MQHSMQLLDLLARTAASGRGRLGALECGAVQAARLGRLNRSQIELINASSAEQRSEPAASPPAARMRAHATVKAASSLSTRQTR